MDDHDWGGDDLDLDAYLTKIGYGGGRGPTAETLRALQRAHVTSIPFENLDALLGRPVLLDVPSLTDKLVRRGRGGYCYEHTMLFAAALERLGFTFTAFHGRVMMGETERLRPATHALLRVTTGEGEVWLCDVGFGGGPLEPIPFEDGALVSQDGWRFRLEHAGTTLGVQEWRLHQYGPDGWIERHRFTLTPQFPVDYAVGNHYVSTHSRSPFTARPFVQRFTAERHEVLDGLTWTTTLPDGTATSRDLEPSALPEALERTFGITVDPQDAATIIASATPADPD